MTICIAAIAEDGRVLVAVSDKMITYTAPPYHQFEHPRSKIDILAPNCIVMTAGSALLPSEYKRLIRHHLQQLSSTSGSASIRQIAEAAKQAYQELRMKVIEDHILRRYGLSWQDYARRIAEGSWTEFSIRLVSQVEDFRLDLIAIVAGVDSEGAHIYVIKNPGEVDCFDDLGYTAIGSGEYHALRGFIENGYSISMSLEKAIYIAFEAKKYAEAAPGVGKETEIAVVTQHGVFKLSSDVIKMLEQVYREKQEKLSKLLREVIEPRIEELKPVLRQQIRL